MRAYKISHGVNVSYAANSTDAAEQRRQLTERLGFPPRSKSVLVEQIDIPTGKEGLLEFLNSEAQAFKREAEQV